MKSSIPYGRHDISQADVDAVVEVLRSDWLTQGPLVPRFEQAVAKFTGANHAVAVNSATSALHIACLALGLGPGDTLWTSPNTFVASANCALYCGADVDFVDIDPRTYNMSVEFLEQKLKTAAKDNKLPKVVIPVHFAGQSCEMEQIHRLSQEYGFRIIEDASHAIGGQYLCQPVGNCRFSDITVFSFHPVKIITTGEGGMAMTNDSILAEKMHRLRTHGITNNQSMMDQRPTEEIWNYQQVDLGFNYRMTDIQAALGLSQLNRLDEFIKTRHQIAKNYTTALENLPITLPWQHPHSISSFHLYPIVLNDKINFKNQKDVYCACHKEGICVNVHYIPVYLHPKYSNLKDWKGSCPASENYFRGTISLPIYPTLGKEKLEKVIAVIKNLLLR